MGAFQFRLLLPLALSAVLHAAPADAAEGVTGDVAPAAVPSVSCAVKTRSERVVIMVCPPGLDREGWQSAGKSACEAGKRCNVWIWDDKKKAPADAPANDAEMPRDRTAAAVAVWVNSSGNLILLSFGRE